MEITPEEKAYIEYLDDLYASAPNYGLLLYRGDPISFREGLRDWYEGLTEENKLNLGLPHKLRLKEYTIQATKTIYTSVFGYCDSDAEDKFLQEEKEGTYEEEWSKFPPKIGIINECTVPNQKVEPEEDSFTY